MNFSARSAPAHPSIEFCSLRRSLNTPVLAIPELPVGPGSAAIAAHLDPCDGLPRYTLAVRSERSRQVVFFSVAEAERGISDPSLAAEAALALAEGMGFLFEEHPPPISREAAALIWATFVEAADPGAFPAAASASPRLTKFRRPIGWSATNAAAPELGAPLAGYGAEAGIEACGDPIAPRGDR